MNILMLSSSYPKFRGDVTAPFIESIATHIAAQGHNVHILLPDHRDLRRGVMEEGVHFHTYRYSPRREWMHWGYAESLRADVKIKRGMFLLAPMVFVSALRSLFSLTALEPFDVIHAHWVLPNAPMAAVAASRRGLPLVISLHGSDVFVAEKWKPLGALSHWCFDQADAITACSDNLTARALALGADEEKTELIPYGADLKAFHADAESVRRVRARLKVSGDELMILGVGRLVYKKGFDYLVQAFDEVRHVAPNARLVLAGDGDLRGELENRAMELGLASSVTFAGMVPRQEIAAYFAASDIVAVPSVRDEAGNVDGLPNVALEAMAAGKPLVATRVAGLPQVVRDGVNGLLVEEKSPPELAEAILRLIRDAGLRQTYGTAGRVRVREALNWDNVARKFIGVYERVRNRAEQ
jgi:glycosyltransferase involved in cell wall biosynthesis